MNIYKRLGVDSRADEVTIKRAYAALIKQYRPETHPQEFAEIRQAYEEARSLLRNPGREQEDRVGYVKVGQARPAQIQNVQRPVSEEKEEFQYKAQYDANTIPTMLRELETAAENPDIKQQLTILLRQQDMLARMPFDLRLDYEQALCHWLLLAKKPPLHIFLQANQNYQWDKNSIEIVNRMGSQAGSRFQTLLRLLQRLQLAAQSRNVFLQINGYRSDKLPPLSSHFLYFDAQKTVSEWKKDCTGNGMEGLADMIRLTAVRGMQIYTLDLELGLICSWIFSMSNNHKQGGTAAPDLIAIFLISTCIPGVLRMIYKWIIEKLSPQLQWLKKELSGNLFYFIIGSVLLLLILPAKAGLVFMTAVSILFMIALLVKGYGALARFEAFILSRMVQNRNIGMNKPA